MTPQLFASDRIISLPRLRGFPQAHVFLEFLGRTKHGVMRSTGQRLTLRRPHAPGSRTPRKLTSTPMSHRHIVDADSALSAVRVGFVGVPLTRRGLLARDFAL